MEPPTLSPTPAPPTDQANVQSPSPVPVPSASFAAPSPSQPGVVKATLCNVIEGNQYTGGATLGTLVWYADNTIKLFKGQSAEQLVFACQPTDIAKFSYFTDHTTIKMKNGTKYKIGFNLDYVKTFMESNEADLTADMLGGVFGLGYYIRSGLPKDVKFFTMDAKNDSKWWGSSLASFGVRTTRTSMVKLTVLTMLGIVGAIMVGCFIYSVIQVFVLE